MLNSKEFSDLFYSERIQDEGVYNPSKLVTVAKCITLLPTTGKVLDIGCFNGFVLDILKEKGYDTYGVDASKTAVDFCNQKGHKALEGDLENEIPFENDYFDSVIGMEIIEHLADTDTFIREIKRVLKPNGVLVFSTPNFFSLSRRIMTLFGINPYFEASFTYPPKMAGHLRFYTHNLLSDFLVHHNFKVTNVSSDLVNLSSDGKFYSKFLAEAFPKIGRGVIIQCQNIK